MCFQRVSISRPWGDFFYTQAQVLFYFFPGSFSRNDLQFGRFRKKNVHAPVAKMTVVYRLFWCSQICDESSLCAIGFVHLFLLFVTIATCVNFTWKTVNFSYLWWLWCDGVRCVSTLPKIAQLIQRNRLIFIINVRIIIFRIRGFVIMWFYLHKTMGSDTSYCISFHIQTKKTMDRIQPTIDWNPPAENRIVSWCPGIPGSRDSRSRAHQSTREGRRCIRASWGTSTDHSTSRLIVVDLKTRPSCQRSFFRSTFSRSLDKSCQNSKLDGLIGAIRRTGSAIMFV